MSTSGSLWSARVERALRGIFERRYFANNGPLVRELDATFAKVHEVAHAVSFVNADVAFAAIAKAVAPGGGDAFVPANANAGTMDALAWAGLAPRVEREYLNSAALALADRSLDLSELAKLEQRVQGALIVDLSDRVGDVSAFRYGTAAIVSMGSNDACYGAGGAVVATNDAHLADMLRTIRNFHAGETFCEVPLRINGKMSELQAAMALCSLADISERANRTA